MTAESWNISMLTSIQFRQSHQVSSLTPFHHSKETVHNCLWLGQLYKHENFLKPVECKNIYITPKSLLNTTTQFV